MISAVLFFIPSIVFFSSRICFLFKNDFSIPFKRLLFVFCFSGVITLSFWVFWKQLFWIFFSYRSPFWGSWFLENDDVPLVMSCFIDLSRFLKSGVAVLACEGVVTSSSLAWHRRALPSPSPVRDSEAVSDLLLHRHLPHISCSFLGGSS